MSHTDRNDLAVLMARASEARDPADAAGILVAAALCVLVDARYTPGDAARLVIAGVRKGLRATAARTERLLEALAHDVDAGGKRGRS